MYETLIKLFCNYLLNCFLNKQKLFLQKDYTYRIFLKDYTYRIFLGLLYNLGISIPTKKTKTNLLEISDFIKFYRNLLDLDKHNILSFDFDRLYIGNSSKINEINYFVQKLYNEDYFESYFTDIELNIINDYTFKETYDLKSLVDNDLFNEYTTYYSDIDEFNKYDEIDYFFE